MPVGAAGLSIQLRCPACRDLLYAAPRRATPSLDKYNAMYDFLRPVSVEALPFPRADLHHLGADGLSEGPHRRYAPFLSCVRAGGLKTPPKREAVTPLECRALSVLSTAITVTWMKRFWRWAGRVRARGLKPAGFVRALGIVAPPAGEIETAVLLPHRPAGGGIRCWRFNRFSVGMQCPNKTVFCAAGINEGYLTQKRQ